MVTERIQQLAREFSSPRYFEGGLGCDGSASQIVEVEDVDVVLLLTQAVDTPHHHDCAQINCGG